MWTDLELTNGSRERRRLVEENKSLDYVLFFMKNLNLVIILYISMLIFTSISGCLRENTAGEFLARAGSLPITAWKLPVMALCLYMLPYS